MESAEFHNALALLDWQIELGATEAIGDAPVDCYQLPDTLAKPKAQSAPPVTGRAEPDAARPDPIAEAEHVAGAAQTLEALREALAGFEHCELKRGARSLVFSDGVPGSSVMIIGEAPGRDEDLQGRPFVGRAGQLLDKMLAAIDMGREHAEAPVFITHVLPWRPPQNRDPHPEEIAMMRPFLERHIALARPRALVIMGNVSAQACLGKRGITRLRGTWTTCFGLPALPMFHPAYLLRQSAAKREAWADLLSLKAHLNNG